MRIVNGATILYILRYLPIFSAQNQYFHTVHMTHIKIYIVYLCCCTVWYITHNIYIGRFILYVKCIPVFYWYPCVCVCMRILAFSFAFDILCPNHPENKRVHDWFIDYAKVYNWALSKTPILTYIYFILRIRWRNTVEVLCTSASLSRIALVYLYIMQYFQFKSGYTYIGYTYRNVGLK